MTVETLKADEKTFITDCLKNFNQERFDLYAYVVMDDHCHVIVQPFTGFPLEKITHSWLSFSAHELQRQFKRTGSVWQREHMIESFGVKPIWMKNPNTSLKIRGGAILVSGDIFGWAPRKGYMAAFLSQTGIFDLQSIFSHSIETGAAGVPAYRSL